MDETRMDEILNKLESIKNDILFCKERAGSDSQARLNAHIIANGDAIVRTVSEVIELLCDAERLIREDERVRLLQAMDSVSKYGYHGRKVDDIVHDVDWAHEGLTPHIKKIEESVAPSRLAEAVGNIPRLTKLEYETIAVYVGDSGETIHCGTLPLGVANTLGNLINRHILQEEYSSRMYVGGSPDYGSFLMLSPYGMKLFELYREENPTCGKPSLTLSTSP